MRTLCGSRALDTMAASRDLSPEQKRQSAALKAAEAGAGRNRTQLAADLGLSYDQYSRYVSGATPLRVSQIRPFAEAYGLPARELTRLLGLVADSPEGAVSTWTFRDALRGRIPEWLISQLAEEWEDQPPLNQRAAVQAILSMAERQRKNATPGLDTHAV